MPRLSQWAFEISEINSEISLYIVACEFDVQTNGRILSNVRKNGDETREKKEKHVFIHRFETRDTKGTGRAGTKIESRDFLPNEKERERSFLSLSLRALLPWKSSFQRYIPTALRLRKRVSSTNIRRIVKQQVSTRSTRQVERDNGNESNILFYRRWITKLGQLENHVKDTSSFSFRRVSFYENRSFGKRRKAKARRILIKGARTFESRHVQGGK